VNILRWLARYFGTLLTAFILAVIVWVSSVVASDPNEERILARPIKIQVVGQDPNLQIIGTIPQNVSLVLRAPASVWTQLNNDPQSVRAWIDLSGLEPGTHEVPVQIQINPHLVRQISQDPENLTITLDSIVSQAFPVSLIVQGNPPIGYQAHTPILQPAEVTITGPQSLVSTVEEVRMTLDITNANQTIIKQLIPLPVDSEDRTVNGVTLTPEAVTVTQPITLLGGYRYVIVRAVSAGQVASGYRLTNIFVSPVGVVVFSSDPELVNNLPGYVETIPIDLTGKADDFESLVDLNLPSGITVVGDPKVLVQVSIAAIESSLAITLPVEMINLSPGLEAAASPATIDVILAGPVPILSKLAPTDVRAVVDLTGYDVGTYQFMPEINILPDQVQKVSALPSTVEITIKVTNTPTPTQTSKPGSATPTPTPTPSK
jgi:YbbR domain-containing protein